MNCPNCGSDVPNEAKFCPSCGRQALAGDAGLTSSGDVEVEPQKKLRQWHKIAIGAVAILAAGAVVRFYPPIWSYLGFGVTGVVQQHVKAIRAGKLDDAYGMTTKQFRKITPKGDFASFIIEHEVLAQNKAMEIQLRPIKNGVATVEGMATSKSGKKLNVRFQLIKEDGSWKIRSVRVQPDVTG